MLESMVVGKGRHFSKFTELFTRTHTHNWGKKFRLLESTWFVRKIDYGMPAGMLESMVVGKDRHFSKFTELFTNNLNLNH